MMKTILPLALLCSVVSWAQQPKQTNGEFTLLQINFVGSKSYSKSDLAVVSGLKPGATVNAQSLRDAADRLAASGAFKEVQYRFNGSTVEFQLMDDPELLPCIFDNFVWYSDNEIQTALRQRVPLYIGSIPNRGNLSNNVSAALEQMLHEKHVDAKVSAMPDTELNGGKLNDVVFSVTNPEMKIGQIRFSGASEKELPMLESNSKRLVDNDYRRTFASNYLSANLLPLYRRDGYLEARFETPTPKIVHSDDSKVVVDLDVKVIEGDRYKIAEIHWVGSEILPQQVAARFILLKPGNIANEELLRKNLGSLGAAYLAKGYMYAKVKAEPTIDEEKKTVRYEVGVAPGDLYHMGKLDVQNLEPALAEKVRQNWSLKPGDVYDPEYVRSFLARDRKALSALDGWSAAFKQFINDETKVVDVALLFQRGGPLK